MYQFIERLCLGSPPSWSTAIFRGACTGAVMGLLIRAFIL